MYWVFCPRCGAHQPMRVTHSRRVERRGGVPKNRLVDSPLHDLRQLREG